MTLIAGTKLGPYAILSSIGAGGMGEVYRARDFKLQRDVAIKVLPQVVANDPETLARFEREALAVASLSHPNILAIHDFGNDNGVAYAVMELLDGDTLRAKLDTGALPHKQALDYALQIARGLSAAHQKGLVHRDLKPENLFVTRNGHVKILDFGLAKKVGTAGPAEVTSAPTVSGHTEPGVVMGTVGYMSPEQVRGLAVDHRSDIFSFGAILYELLSGKRAFRKQTAADTMSAILKEEPLELTGAGPALDHIVRHCLEKDRDDRFQSAKDIAFALGETSSFPIPNEAEKAVRPSGKRMILVGIAAIVVLVAAVLFLMRQPQRVSGSAGVKRLAVLPFENLGSPAEDYFADGMADEIRSKLTSLPGVEIVARGSSVGYKKTTKSLRQIGDELEAKYILTATVRWQKGEGTSRVHVTPELVELGTSGPPVSRWQQPFDATLTDVFQVQAEIASRAAQALGATLGAGDERRLAATPTQDMMAYDAFLKGEQAGNDWRQAGAFYDQAVALDPSFAQAWAGVSIVNSKMYTRTATRELAEKSREAAEKAVSFAPDRAEGYLARGLYDENVLIDYERALAEYTKGHQLAPSDAEILSRLAAVEEALGRSEAAIDHLRQAEHFNPRLALPKAALGESLLNQRRYREAREAFDRALVLAPTDVGLIHLKAMTFLGEGDLAGARAVIRAAPKEIEPTVLVVVFAQQADLGWVLDASQRDLLLRLTPSAFDDLKQQWAICLAQAYFLKGDTSSTQIHAEQARTGFEEQLRAAPEGSDAQGHAFLGLALAYLGRKEEAIREGERGVALMPAAKDEWVRAYLVNLLARTYTLVGEQEKAIDMLESLLRARYFVSPAWLRIDPNFDPLRSNPRFQKLIAAAK